MIKKQATLVACYERDLHQSGGRQDLADLDAERTNGDPTAYEDTPSGEFVRSVSNLRKI